MAIAYFASLEQADVMEVVFDKADGGEVALCLLVDSGFTGESCFVLPTANGNVHQAQATDSQLSGALKGPQKRSVVTGAIPALSVRFEALAVVADLSHLTLPNEVHGIVGLRFLRQFRRWGAEKTSGATWRFFLEIDSNSNGS